MKTIAYLVFLCFFALSTTSAVAGNSRSKSVKEKPEVTVVKDKKMSDEEMDKIVKRVEEISKMDRSKLSTKEKSELHKELKGLKKEVHKHGYILYISGSTLLIIILILLLI